jgi:RNA polymerase sigma-70 factor, ECF subfamily
MRRRPRFLPKKSNVPKNRPARGSAARFFLAANNLHHPTAKAIMVSRAKLLVHRGGTAVAAEESFIEVMARLRAGDSAAAAAVFERFARRLIALARTRLDSQIRQKLDPEDVVQSVYKSFFLRHAQGQFDLDSWDSLWTLLTVLTVRKCGRWAAYFQAECRDVRAEATPRPGAESAGRGWEALDREPSPAEAAMLAETVEELFRGLEGRERAIVSLGLQGYTAPEISGQLRRPERTVYRVLERVKKHLLRLQARQAESG